MDRKGVNPLFFRIQMWDISSWICRCVVIEDDMEWRREQRSLPSGLAGTASGRWGRSACGTRLWPACWTWGWSHRAEPPAPTPCRGCSRPSLKSWPPQPPYTQQQERRRRRTGQGTDSSQWRKRQDTHQYMYSTTLRKSSADNQHTQVLMENSTYWADSLVGWIKCKFKFLFKIKIWEILLFPNPFSINLCSLSPFLGSVGLCWFSRV